MNFTTEQIEDFGYDLFAEDRPRLFEAQNEILRLEKQRDELLSDLTEAKRSAEFNFEQYQDVGRLLHEECEKTEKLLAALERLLASHGYTSYLSEAEEDEDPDVIAARSAIASAKKNLFGDSTNMVETSVPAIVFYPAGSLGEEVQP